MCKKVSILLSIYKPIEEYLKKQLISLNEQTYENLELVVWNDCPDCEVDETIFASHITKFPFKIYDQHINLGYAKAFEKLVTFAQGEYICFCDQDDIWDKEKIKKCITALEEENGAVAVCDKSIIDENDKIVIESVKKSSNWSYEKWATGDDITHKAIFMCHAPGMSIHARKSDVEKYIPFAPEVAHDRWLMAMLSAQGKAVYVEEALVKYRRYGRNVSGVLSGIQTKKEYYAIRCNNTNFISRFKQYFPNHQHIEKIEKCNSARMSGNPIKIFKNRGCIPDLFKYEFLLALCPDFLFRPLVKLLFK